ncbi:MAG: hypothetical protein LAP86_10290 [Acidobacteriia bacterium]|nr:hypothetical protein [Terriglobia bacterium]
MGYDVHITRKIANGPEISLAEWTEYVKSDPEMRLDGFAQAANLKTDETIRYENAGVALWTAYSQKPNTPWFDYRRGKIVVKNLDPEILAKMWQIAQALSANVQGDEGEIYDQAGNVVG